MNLTSHYAKELTQKDSNLIVNNQGALEVLKPGMGSVTKIKSHFHALKIDTMEMNLQLADAFGLFTGQAPPMLPQTILIVTPRHNQTVADFAHLTVPHVIVF